MIATFANPVIALKGFQRIHLKAGESKEVTFTVTPEMLSILDEKLQPVVEPGDFKIMIGASSADIRLMSLLTVKWKSLLPLSSAKQNGFKENIVQKPLYEKSRFKFSNNE